eukprot:Partr_v1_DN26360_c1_g1_i3_m43271 putative replication factor c
MPSYKLIILDEADSMTVDAQSALRRTIETYAKCTRFCLICNYVSRIIEPLASRCAKFRFKPMDSKSAIARLRDICMAEGIGMAIKDDILQRVVEISDGDLRRAITYLQTLTRLLFTNGTLAPASDEVLEIVDEIAGVVSSTRMDKFMDAVVVRSDSTASREFATVQQEVDDMMANGYSAFQVLVQINQRLIADPSISARKKCIISSKLAETEKRLKDGAHPRLQLLDLCLVMAAGN